MRQQTASQTVGPFFAVGLTYGEFNNLVTDETRGERIYLAGRLLDGDGEPIVDAVVEIWQADANGIYNHSLDDRQAEADGAFSGFGRTATDDNGAYSFKTIRPGAVGDMAPHINVHIFMRGLLLHVTTRIYFSDIDFSDTDFSDTANSTDPILSRIPADRRQTLIAQRDASEGTPIYRLDFHMQGDAETVFFEP